MDGIIYALKDPTTKEVRYIGKSVSGMSRPLSHWRRRKESRHAHFRVYRWLNTLNEPPEIEILESCERDLLSDRERLWIAVYSAACRLTNMTKGGDGTLGRKLSKETRAKIATRATGRKSSTRGIKLSPERRKHLSEVRLAYSQTPEGMATLSESQKKRMSRPEEYEKICKRLESYRKRKRIICSNGCVYESIRSAARELGIHSPNIVAVLKGRYNTTAGLTFRYEELEGHEKLS